VDIAKDLDGCLCCSDTEILQNQQREEERRKRGGKNWTRDLTDHKQTFQYIHSLLLCSA